QANVTITNDAIGDGQLAFDTGQNLTTTSSPTFNGLTVSSLTRGSDTITDFTGTGLQVTAGALETTLGTSVDLTSEITGILPVANGGTGANLTLSSLNAQGSVPFFNASGVMTTLAPGTGGFVLTTNGAGADPTWTNAASLGTNYLQRNSTTLAPGNAATVTDKFVLGGNTTTNNQFEVNGRQTGKALVSFNETGNQAIFTASASGVT